MGTIYYISVQIAASHTVSVVTAHVLGEQIRRDMQKLLNEVAPGATAVVWQGADREVIYIAEDE